MVSNPLLVKYESFSGVDFEVLSFRDTFSSG